MTVTVVYSGTADGYIESYATTYAAARSGGALVASAAAVFALVGQQYIDNEGAAEFYVWESFLGFDTSAVGTDTISAAVLNVTSNADNSTTDFTIEARLRDWGATLETTDYVAGASLSGLTSLATKTTASGFTAGTAYDFTDVALPANVNKTGTTRMLVCSSRTTAGTAPTGDEYVDVRSADYAGTTSDPKLTVTHAAAGGTTVTPTTLALTTTAYAPSVVVGVVATPGVAALTLATYVPTVAVSNNQTVTPGVASLALTAFAPSTVISDNILVAPSTAALSLTAFAPTVTGGAGMTVTPAVAALVLTTFAPAVTASDHQLVTPSTASLLLTGFAPSVLVPVLVTPSTAALLLTTYAPTVVATEHQLVTPATLALTLTAFAPTVTGGGTIVTGGFPPSGSGSHLVPAGSASSLVPRGSASHLTPEV